MRDSSGVEIVENRGPRFAGTPPIELSRRAALRIGSIDGDDSFGRPTDATRLSDGTILVLDTQPAAIYVFDSSGRTEEKWGRAGEGPGEFVRPTSIDRIPGDTVIVLDRGAFRTTVFGPDGTTVRTFQALFDFQRPANHFVAQSCCVPVIPIDGATTLWRYPQVWSLEGSGRRPTYTTVIRSTPERTDTLAVLQSGTAGEWPGGVNPVIREAFGPGLYFGRSSDHLIIGSSERLGFEVRDLETGGTLRRVMGSEPRVEVTAEMIAASIGDSREITPELRNRLLNRPHADSVAAYSDLLVSPAGEVWLRSPSPMGPRLRSAYHIFSSEGEWMGEVEFPDYIWLVEVGPNYALGFTRGDFDESYLELWEFERDWSVP